MKIKDIIPNRDNPRFINKEQYSKLLTSIKEFPEMLEARPLLIDENNVVLGGNMRLKALTELGKTEVPVKQVKGWSEEQKKEFIIKDNLSYGSWDWDTIANEWDIEELNEWGLNTSGFLGSDEPGEDIVLNPNKEVDVDSMESELNCACPKCGFKFKQ